MSKTHNERSEMRRIHHIHFVGIGGTGMGGIAEVLLGEGYHVTGSDLSQNEMTVRLLLQGAIVFNDHDAKHVENADVVVISSAIRPGHVELEAAKKLAIPVVPRAEMLAELMRFRYGIAIAGTHGKTTTTSLTASILAEAGVDPTFIIGGRLNSFGSNAKLGTGKYLVAEADESDASFLHLHPMMAVITNIDEDHMGTYGGDFSRLKATFLEFIHRMPFYGLAILCLDDPVVKKIIPKAARPVLTYGFDEKANVRAVGFSQKGMVSHFTVLRSCRDKPLSIELNLPGKHNVLNALAAIAIATDVGVDDPSIVKALKNFEGVGRRFQTIGHYPLNEGKVLVIDDYGHHPREVAATIQAARDSFPDQRIAMVFQPHRYSRTRDLFEDFVQVLSEVDILVVLDVYTAGESHIPGADSKALCRNIRLRGKVDPIFVKQIEKLPHVLKELLTHEDVLFSQGAGSVSQIMRNLVFDE